MPSLRTRALRDGRLTYSVLFRLDGRQTSETFDTEGAAKAFVKDIDRYGPDSARRLLDSRRDRTPQRRTVAEQVQHNIDTLSAITIGTRRKYEAVAREIAAHRLGTMPIDVVHRSDVSAWIRDLADSGLATSSIELRRTVLSAAFAGAIKDEVLARNPCFRVQIPRMESREQTYLTREEFARIYDRADPGDQVLLYTLVSTGLRIGEATALKVGDLHLYDAPPTLSVHRGWTHTAGPERATGAPKTRHGRRTIALPADLADMLRDHVSGRAVGDWVFVGPGGAPVAHNRLRERWARAVKAAGIGKSPRLHDLRHTHASWLIAAGVPLPTVKHRLGHASISVTSDVYGHLMPESQVQAARAASLGLAWEAPAIEA